MKLPTIVNLDWTNEKCPVPNIGQQVRSRIVVYPLHHGERLPLRPGALGVVVGFQGMKYSTHPHETGTRYFLCPVVRFEFGEPITLVPNEVDAS